MHKNAYQTGNDFGIIFGIESLRMFHKIADILKSVLMLLAVTLVAILPCQYALSAGAPGYMGYQGRLSDSNGNLLGGTGSTYYFKFSLWNAASGGTQVWPAVAPSSVPLTVKKGVFVANIGDTSAGFAQALDYDFNNTTDTYLEVSVSSDNATFQTLVPRQKISSIPFAQLSGAVSGSAHPSSFGTTVPFGTSIVSIQATSTGSVAATLRGIAGQVANLFQIQNSSGTNLFAIDSSGGLLASSTLSVTGATNLYSTLNVSGNASFGTITAGTWNGTAIDVAHGGTASTTLGGILSGNGIGAVKSVAIGPGLSWDGRTLAVTAMNAASTTLLTDRNTWSGVNLLTNSANTYAGTWQGNAIDDSSISSAAIWNAKYNGTQFGSDFYALFHATSTDALAQGSTNKYYSDVLVNSFINSSSTIAKTFANQTWTGSNIFNNTITGNISGNAGTAAALQTPRFINGVSFNGSADITISSTTLLANNNTWSGINVFGTTYLGSLGGLLKGTAGLVGVATEGNDYLSTVRADYPLQGAGTSSSHLSIAFGTTTTNTWQSAQTFTAAPVLSSLSGLLKGNGSSAVGIATYPDVVSLFSGCTGTQYLGADGACHTPAAGAGGAASTWSTTTSQVPGELNNYAINATDNVLVGGSSTTTSKMYFDPNAIVSKIGTVISGTWNGNAIQDTYISSAALWNTVSSSAWKSEDG